MPFASFNDFPSVQKRQFSTGLYHLRQMEGKKSLKNDLSLRYLRAREQLGQNNGFIQLPDCQVDIKIYFSMSRQKVA